ncbi:nucleotide disphospho-sugar-binding domain-containing protein [Actinocrinis sp.]|uniref:nucleotide disphospho-sugar-binding domain-containing protein n=1 Tax=Actinocrinis sp. TaxID=1920516 RepID=UPI002CEE963E|nr:nucleotide disphospho-sugar-binding domain-containing protein [Actinocrinis sp.]HXR70968.1 nucleotide disphospho-sugar-binding domain-containing protein [Actinocrinis sp.]
MRILVNTGPAYGLYNPLVPLAWALRSAGHEVLVAGPEPMAGMVNGSGLPFTPIYGPMHMREFMLHDREGRPLVQASDEDAQLEQIGRGFGRLAGRVLDGLLRVTRQWRPDVVIAEPHAYAAAVAAEINGIPWIEHGIGMGYRAVCDEWGVDEFGPELSRYGFSGLPGPAAVLDNCPPTLRRDDAKPGIAMRYVAYDKPGTVPDWVMEPKRRPRLLLTLGTVEPEFVGVNRNIAGGLPLFQDLLRTLPTLGLDIVVAAADSVVEQLRPLPEAVIAAGWLPLTAVLPACDLAVHHVGAGTTMACLLAGLPEVLISRNAEQTDTARRLHTDGAAIQLVSEHLETGAVLEACRALLENPRHRERAQALRDEVATLPSPAQLVPRIEQIVAEHAGSLAPALA